MVGNGPQTPGIDDASSVMSSTFSLGEPVVAHAEIDSDDEEEVNGMVEGIKGASLEESESESTSASTHAPSTSGAAPAAQLLARCLFCNYDSPTVPLNVVHMERIHGMFIPERPYLVNLEGLIGSLYEKINEYHECLYCGKLKQSIFGLQTHMRDKGHCKIAFETEDQQLEIGEFYDFTGTYSDDGEYDSDEEDEAKAGGGVKLGLKRPTKIHNENGDETMADADGWETDSSASSLDSDDLTAVPMENHEHQYQKMDKHPHHSTSNDPRPHRNADGWHSHAHKHARAAFYSDYELHLPSGRAVGHRSLNKYYRQNLHNHPSPAEQQEQHAIENGSGTDSDEDDNDMSVIRRGQDNRGRAMISRSNQMGMVGVSDEKKREVKIAEKKARKLELRDRARFQAGNNKQGNFQKHFRVSITGFGFQVISLMLSSGSSAAMILLRASPNWRERRSPVRGTFTFWWFSVIAQSIAGLLLVQMCFATAQQMCRCSKPSS